MNFSQNYENVYFFFLLRDGEREKIVDEILRELNGKITINIIEKTFKIEKAK